MGIEREPDRSQNPAVSTEEKPAGIPGKGLQIWGDVRLAADGVIQGAVQGSVWGKEKVIVSENSQVSGSVEGSDVRIDGVVQGGVSARGRVWMGSRAKVKLRCAGRAVRIEPGAEFRGELQVG